MTMMTQYDLEMNGYMFNIVHTAYYVHVGVSHDRYPRWKAIAEHPVRKEALHEALVQTIRHFVENRLEE